MADPEPLPPTGKRVKELEEKLADLETKLAAATTGREKLEAEVRKLNAALEELKPKEKPAKKGLFSDWLSKK